MVRKPVVDGSFYPEDSSVLSSTIDQYLNNVDVEVQGEILGVISPHAGYIYSGQTAAYVYNILKKGKDKNLVILLGPSHRYYVKGFAVYEGGDWETPLGKVKTDKDFISKLKSHSDLIESVSQAHAQEHSLEVQVPFLQKVLKDFKIVPIVFNSEDPSELSVLSYALYKELKDRKNWVILTSSDLYHGENYDMAKGVTDEVDNYIKNLDYKGLLEYDRAMRESGVCAACGCSPIAVLMQVMEKFDVEVRLLKRTTSGDVTGDKSGYVVGYGAWVFLRNKTEKNTDLKTGLDFSLTSQDKEKLLDVARKTVTKYVKNKKTPEFTVDSEVLKKKCGAFVTLKKKNGALRGCIGLIVAEKPLFITVRDMAIAAATQDPRFPPVEPSELSDIEIEISVLTPMQKVDNADEIEVGRDGLMIRRGYASGLLLPQVPVEQGWDKKIFLEHTCYKAGLPADAWKSSELWKFQAIVFSEK